MIQRSLEKTLAFTAKVIDFSSFAHDVLGLAANRIFPGTANGRPSTLPAISAAVSESTTHRAI